MCINTFKYYVQHLYHEIIMVAILCATVTQSSILSHGSCVTHWFCFRKLYMTCIYHFSFQSHYSLFFLFSHCLWLILSLMLPARSLFPAAAWSRNISANIFQLLLFHYINGWKYKYYLSVHVRPDINKSQALQLGNTPHIKVFDRHTVIS